MRSLPGKLNRLERHRRKHGIIKGGLSTAVGPGRASEHLYQEMGQSPEQEEQERRPRAVPIATGQAALRRTLITSVASEGPAKASGAALVQRLADPRLSPNGSSASLIGSDS